MARTRKRDPKRLTPEQIARRAELMQIVNRFNRKGHTGTLYHEELARLDAIEASIDDDPVVEAEETPAEEELNGESEESTTVD